MAEEAYETTLRLVRAAQAGEEKALNDLFVRYLPRTRRIVAARMGWKLQQLHDYEDLVQESLLKVFQGLERFEARSEGSFRHWVAECVECTIRNAVRDSQRAKRGGGAVKRWSELQNENLSALTFAGDSPTPSAIVQASELEERIEAALLLLPKRYRDAIVLRSFCEMSYTEIKDSLGVEHEATARQICFRAMQKLGELLSP